MNVSRRHILKCSALAALIIGFSGLFGVCPAAAGDPDFIKAVRSDKEARVERFIAGDADVNQRDELGRTPLHHAAQAGARNAVPLLLAAGADMEARDADGATPLLAGGFRKRMITTLVAYGARVNISADNGTTLLHLACRNSVTSVGLILALGADTNPRDLRGRTPLHELVQQGQTAQTIQSASGEEEREDYLYPLGNNPAQKRGWRHTLRGSEEDVYNAVLRLLNHHAEINAADLEGKTPLDLARLDSVQELLISRGAEPGAGSAP